MEAALWTAFGLAALSLLLTVVAFLRSKPAWELTQQLHSVEQDLNSLTEHLTRMETRQRVRKLRDSRESPSSPPMVSTPQQPMTRLDYKRALRSRHASLATPPEPQETTQ